MGKNPGSKSRNVQAGKRIAKSSTRNSKLRNAPPEIRNPQSAIRNPKLRNPQAALAKPLVAIVMGSQSDWETMRTASETLERFGVAHESRVISAHRSPQLAAEYSSNAESKGLEVIIAAAGGAAHLAGVFAAHTTLPVLGVPMKSDALKGLDSLLSTVQMPAGIPVATLAIGKPGATNAALFAVAILANGNPTLRAKLWEFRREQEKKIQATELS